MGILKDGQISKIKKNFDFDVSDLGLSLAELKFLGELCVRGFDYATAHDIAGFSGANRTEHQIEGRKLAAKPNMAEAIQRFIDTAIGPYIQTLQYEAMEALRGMATWKPQDFYNPDGSPRPFDEIPEDKLYAIDGIEDKYFGKDATKKVRNLKLTDRKQAWKMLLDLKKEGVGVKKKADTEKEDKLKQIFEGVLTGKKKMTVSERMRKVELQEAKEDSEDENAGDNEDSE